MRLVSSLFNLAQIRNFTPTLSIPYSELHRHLLASLFKVLTRFCSLEQDKTGEEK